MIGGEETVDFFSNLGSILDDVEIHESVDSGFSENYNLAMNRLRYSLKRDTPVIPKKIMKVYGNGIMRIDCGNCGNSSINGNPHYKFCPNCGFRIKW